MHGERSMSEPEPQWALMILTMSDYAQLEEYEEKRKLNEALTVYDRTIDIMKKYLSD